jgi:hypothetical protein
MVDWAQKGSAGTLCPLLKAAPQRRKPQRPDPQASLCVPTDLCVALCPGPWQVPVWDLKFEI